MKTAEGRPATKIEIEAMGAICSLQDELHEAQQIIRALKDEEKLIEFANLCREYPNEPVLNLWSRIFTGEKT